MHLWLLVIPRLMDHLPEQILGGKLGLLSLQMCHDAQTLQRNLLQVPRCADGSDGWKEEPWKTQDIRALAWFIRSHTAFYTQEGAQCN